MPGASFAPSTMSPKAFEVLLDDVLFIDEGDHAHFTLAGGANEGIGLLTQFLRVFPGPLVPLAGQATPVFTAP